MKTKTVPLESIVFDFAYYPRAQRNSTHIRMMCDSFYAGASFPPLIIDAKSKRCVDGFHRGEMYRKCGVARVPVEEKHYKTDAEILLDAIRLNATHGRTLTPYDRVHGILLADKLHISEEDLAIALSLTCEAVRELRADRIGMLRVSGKPADSVPLKRTIQHMAGKTLTKAQGEANDKLSGMSPTFYANQLILILENDLWREDDANFLARLQVLARLLKEKI